MASLVFLKNKTLNSTYTVSAPITKQHYSNIYASNFWMPQTAGNYNITGMAGVVADPWAPLPFTGPAPSVSYPINIPRAHPLFEFECVDHANDTIMRINILVRSWSQDSSFTASATSGLCGGAACTAAQVAALANAYGSEGFPFNDQDILDFWTWLSGNADPTDLPVSNGFGSSTFPEDFQ